jgi:hypothetical protein
VKCGLFDPMYDAATYHCNNCGWDGDGWELKSGCCLKCGGKNVEETSDESE